MLKRFNQWVVKYIFFKSPFKFFNGSTWLHRFDDLVLFYQVLEVAFCLILTRSGYFVDSWWRGGNSCNLFKCIISVGQQTRNWMKLLRYIVCFVLEIKANLHFFLSSKNVELCFKKMRSEASFLYVMKACLRKEITL